jgi:hypothetical protein
VPVSLPITVPVVLPELPDMEDHRIAEKATVPAVELLELLVKTVAEHEGNPGWMSLPLTMTGATFPKFLPADEIARCTFDVTLDKAVHGVRAALISRIALAGGMQRSRVHAIATLGAAADSPPLPPDFDCDFEVSAERVYHELITFGPRYCNLRGGVRLGRAGATATVRSPVPPRSPPPLGSCPYLLDAAMHLACVWGQRYAGFVAYPTGFDARWLSLPVAAGERHCIVAPRIVEPRRLLCDLWLTGLEGEICDTIVGLTMSPLANGSPPPVWILASQDRP